MNNIYKVYTKLLEKEKKRSYNLMSIPPPLKIMELLQLQYEWQYHARKAILKGWQKMYVCIKSANSKDADWVILHSMQRDQMFLLHMWGG